MRGARAILLAGGFATRLWPLTESTCKPLLSVAGKPLLGHILKGVPHMPTSVTTNKIFAQDVEDYLQKDFPERGIEVFVEDGDSERKKTGALAATTLTVESWEEEKDLLLIGADNYFGFSLGEYVSYAQDLDAPVVAVYDIGDRSAASSFGVVVRDEKTGQIQEFLEKPVDPPSSLVATACFWIPKRYLSVMAEYSKLKNDDVGGLFEHFLSEGITCYAYAFSEEWYDIGSFEHYLSANRSLYGERKNIHKNASVSQDCEMRGMVEIGPGCQIEGSVLENVILQEGVKIKGSEVRMSVIGAESRLRGVSLSGVSLRAGSRVQREG